MVILSEILVEISEGNSFFLVLLVRLELELGFDCVRFELEPGCGAFVAELGPILTVGTLALPDWDLCGIYARVLLT